MNSMRWIQSLLAAVLIVAGLAVTAAEVPQSGNNEIFIDVGQAQAKKSLLALTPLLYIGSQKTSTSHIQVGQNLYRVIVNDLSVSNFFVFVKPDAYLEDPGKVGLKPAPYEPNGFNFNNWKTIGTEFLVRAAYQVLDDDILLEVYVYHVPTARMVLGKNYKASTNNYRRLGHTFANDFIKSLTGKKGMFLSKLVASKQEPGSQIKDIYITDWDGANPQRVSNRQTISISPAWSTGGDKIAYSSFAFHKREKMRNNDMFVYDIPTNKSFLLSYRRGINSGAAFIPGDKQLLLTMSADGAADIYKSTADGFTVSPMTNGPNRAMNVEPAVSPDGRKVAFSSDRSGKIAIYTMDIDGSNVKRVTFAGKYNASPAWSPDGKALAFAAQDHDHFDIFTMSPDGSNMKRLTDARKPNGKAANNESPSWSPDGRSILFTSDRTGNYQLYLVSSDGTGERRITEDHANWDKPKWSPYLE